MSAAISPILCTRRVYLAICRILGGGAGSWAYPEATPAAHGGRPGLRREIGFVGLIWASEGSIIGSGWLFGAQKALGVAGPAAIISWGIGSVAILILALVHAELGGMYPVSGGTARFPHYAFGGAAGASFGWFSWLQAATVAPIEVLAMITYGQHYSCAQGWLKIKGGQDILTGSGIVVAVVLMAIITAVNFLGIRLAGAHQQRGDLVEGRHPAADDLRVGHRPASTRATSPLPTASTPTARRASWPRSRRAASSSRCSASSRPTSSPGRARIRSATSRAR